MTRLDVTGLTVAFGGVRPLDDVTLTFPGGVCGLVGPNGAGKTTFFNVLSGFVRPIEGAVGCDGEDVLGMRAHHRARWGLRRTFQQEQVIHALSAYDNVMLAADHLGASRADTSAVLDFVGLRDVRRTGSKLSMLERRLVELAKTVIGRPRVVLLDEPGAGLSDQESSVLTELILEVPRRFGALVILVDHDMDLVKGVCQTTAVLDFGRRIALGPTAEVLADEQVKRAYLGTEEVV